MKMKFLLIALFGVLSVAGSANAKTVRTTHTNVIDTTISSNAYGGCIALLNMDITKFAPNCPGAASGSYVVFSCDGSLQDAAAGTQLFEAVQMGQMLGKPVRVHVDDAKKINGYCLVNRVDIK